MITRNSHPKVGVVVCSTLIFQTVFLSHRGAIAPARAPAFILLFCWNGRRKQSERRQGALGPGCSTSTTTRREKAQLCSILNARHDVCMYTCVYVRPGKASLGVLEAADGSGQMVPIQQASAVAASTALLLFGAALNGTYVQERVKC